MKLKNISFFVIVFLSLTACRGERKKIEDMSEEELSSKSGKAYDKAMPEPDTTFNSSKKTPARKVAEQMEIERTYPMSSKMAKETPMMAQTAKDALKGGLG
ncbi:MAG: hypothetical protein EBU01_13575, partial [Crocinitomicaceae bacterium]|nr:hypothetical protein [Crocinitomicaceae bacterium]